MKPRSWKTEVSSGAEEYHPNLIVHRSQGCLLFFLSGV